MLSITSSSRRLRSASPNNVEIYRFVTPARRGEWRESRRRAMLDAARAGFGSVDEHPAAPGEERRIYLHPFVAIETTVLAEQAA